MQPNTPEYGFDVNVFKVSGTEWMLVFSSPPREPTQVPGPLGLPSPAAQAVGRPGT